MTQSPGDRHMPGTVSTITTVISPSEYVAEPHMNFLVDGVPLDALLDGWYPNRQISGLIPTTLNWLHSDNEQAVVWNRFLDRTANRSIVPILCCPDDLDFSCVLVVADTRISAEHVEWRAFGFDTTPTGRLPDNIGATVDWLPRKDALCFDRAEFDAVASRFRKWAQDQKSA